MHRIYFVKNESKTAKLCFNYKHISLTVIFFFICVQFTWFLFIVQYKKSKEYVNGLQIIIYINFIYNLFIDYSINHIDCVVLQNNPILIY